MKYQFDWLAVLKGEYGEMVWQGFLMTMKISAVALVMALTLGVIIAIFRMSRVKVLDWFGLAYAELFRNTPLLVQIFFWYFGSDPLLPEPVKKWLYAGNFEFAAGVIALGVYTSAFIAEDIRSGVFAIPKTQLEASRATGLSFLQSMRLVILPQAFRIIIPQLISQSLNLVKNSPLVMTIGVAELTYQAKLIESYTLRGFEIFTISTLMYLAVSLTISFLITMYDRHFLRAIRY